MNPRSSKNPSSSGRDALSEMRDTLSLRQWMDDLDGTPLDSRRLVRALVPLLRQVATAHDSDAVAPLDGIGGLRVADGRLWFEDAAALATRDATAALQEVERRVSPDLQLVSESRFTRRAEGGLAEHDNLSVGRRGDSVDRPMYLPGYRAWEQHLGHHDALSDIFVCGLVAAALACGLDLGDHGAVLRFAEARHDLRRLAPGLHPVIARLIRQMTELDRRRRAQDLLGLARQLEDYREVEVDVEFNVDQIEGFKQRDRSGKRRAVLAHLEERLFEISRRNPLLHFRPRTNTLNLTLASVPLLVPLETLNAQDVLAWWPWLQQRVVDAKPLALASYLSFRDAFYLPATLNKIRLEAARDEREVGFSNLRLAIAFLRWHNLKEDPDRRLDSPLLLLPVKLIRKKGVRDQFLLEPLSSEAEVNPVLRRHLEALYGLRLPESIDLGVTDPTRFHALLQEQIHASEPAVQLELVEQPRIHLIHREAKRTLEAFNRRRRRRRVRSYRDLDYSYDLNDFQPLGLRLFQTRAQPTLVELESLIEDPEWLAQRSAEDDEPADGTEPDGNEETKAETSEADGSEADEPQPETSQPETPQPEDDVRRRSFVHFTEGGDTGPHHWEMDLTALTLGNFRYRKMTLVRDYGALLEEDRPNPIFDGLFSVAPRPESSPAEPLPVEESYAVLPADPTQSSAVGAARRGDSYIIQGPPGTGKSQTIANLIADFAARGRRVLFVCQKRAALDVVYLRLKALGLDPLACLVHDAQVDKKAVIHDLRATYERFMGKGPEVPPEAPRRARLAELEQALAPLEALDAAMRRQGEGHGLSVHGLLSRSVELGALETQADEAVLVHELPRYGVWHEGRDGLEELGHSLKKVQADGVYAHHPLAPLAPSLAVDAPPEASLRQDLQGLRERLESLIQELGAVGLPEDPERTWTEADEIVSLAVRLRPLAERDLLDLVDGKSRASDRLERDLEETANVREQLAEAEALNGHWRQKWPADEVDVALGQARPLEGNPLAFLLPTFWRLRSALNAAYDWQGHAVRPTRSQVLERLADEHRLRKALDKKQGRLGEYLGLNPSKPEALGSFLLELEGLRRAFGDPSDQAAARIAQARLGPDATLRLVALEKPLEDLKTELRDFVYLADATSLPESAKLLDRLLASLSLWNAFLPCLRAVSTLDPALVERLQTLPWTLPKLESALLRRSLDELYRGGLPAMGHDERRRRLLELAEALEGMRLANVDFVLDRAHGAFQKQIARGRRPGDDPSAEEREELKRYNEGRRILEHEFGKQMRYKSIRDLWSGAPGAVMRDLKPIWLMSPLSVSDTLSLQEGHFDVVIFDEASQIPVEEAIPALFRAPQAIVVGDQMQLPPTRFFASQRRDDEILMVEGDGETVEFDLSANSFLSQAAKRLPSTMLGWHYRSRSEALISFSNAAFYGGRLLVVPEERLPRTDTTPLRLEVGSGGAGAAAEALRRQAEHGAAQLLERAVSSHFIVDGVYEKRRNTREADYIAALVAALLRRDTGLSLGIVAFSEAQQNEIEQALDRLARRDTDFQKLYLAELEREEDGEMVGLILKNLENIQGDERDIMLLSVCYGPDPEGRCRMGFGPINQAGGEKRLNVAFSRSKHHMAVVTSMSFDRITNTYNNGAAALRQYLRYAAAASVDDGETVDTVLRELRGPLPGSDDGRTDHPVVSQLAEALQNEGFLVDRRVGQSLLRCDLAVYRPGDEVYRLGILVDTDEHYAQTDVIERDLVKPKLLEDFGWSMATVWTQDWYLDRQAVLDRLRERLADPEADPKAPSTRTDS